MILYHDNGNDTEKSPHLGSYLNTTEEQGNVSAKLYVEVRDWSLFIGRGAGANRGWATIFYSWLKMGAIIKYANVLPVKMLKAASGCHQQIQHIKTALYNNFY